eukprot:TRINITY_DN2561_c0_g1_i1.p3 TRINITY_DN2561_c0_g1~~TRINITY_DN2561_c0_g1_i1.p3  ORF type:complete len:109 (-),score=25.76 TRINITY_DN2561_c0_g1_i1:1553-1879(-)
MLRHALALVASSEAAAQSSSAATSHAEEHPAALALVYDNPPTTPQLLLPPRNTPSIMQQQLQLSPSMAAAPEFMAALSFRRPVLEFIMDHPPSSLPGLPLPASLLQQP